MDTLGPLIFKIYKKINFYEININKQKNNNKTKKKKKENRLQSEK